MDNQPLLPFEGDGEAESGGDCKKSNGDDQPRPPNPYEERLAARRERLEDAAARARERSDAAFEASRKAVEHIPFGQPILRGHHSERGHRRDLERSHRAMDRSVEEANRARELERRAARVGTGGISADDPEAVVKLEAKLEQMEARRELMKRVNRQYRRGGWDAVEGLSEEARARFASEMERMPFRGESPFPAYSLKNLGANIRRVRSRIDELRREHAERDAEIVEGEGYTVEEDLETNRVRFLFDCKPSASVRSVLKANGFRWTPSVGAWQRQINAAGRVSAERVRAALDAESGTD